MTERKDESQKNTSCVVKTGCGQMIFRRDDKGQIVYDEEGRVVGEGYPYATLTRNVVATESDIKELIKSVLPK